MTEKLKSNILVIIITIIFLFLYIGFTYKANQTFDHFRSEVDHAIVREYTSKQSQPVKPIEEIQIGKIKLSVN